MTPKSRRLGYVAQNVILGTITGVMVGFNLKVFFQRIGGVELIWILFFLLGPALGYLSGKERQRIEKLKKEKSELKENLSKIQDALARSAKKYQLLVEHVNDAIFLTTYEGRFVLFNEATSLMTGYDRNKLKKMSISELKAESGATDSEQAWSDNGVSRYEERWRNKSGKMLYLEIDARWIHFGDHRLILHVARNVHRRREADGEIKARRIRTFHESFTLETAAAQKGLLQYVLGPVSMMVQALQQDMVGCAGETAKLSDSLSQLNKTSKLLKLFKTKFERDLKTSPSQWDLNDILKQEILYIQSMTDAGRSISASDISKKLPHVYGFGRDFSFVFHHTIFAALESIESLNQRDLALKTQIMDDHILVEMCAAGAVDFKKHLCHRIDPSFKAGETSSAGAIDDGFRICEWIFESFGVNIDVAEREREGTIIRIRVPVYESSEKTSAPTQPVETEEVLLI